MFAAVLLAAAFAQIVLSVPANVVNPLAQAAFQFIAYETADDLFAIVALENIPPTTVFFTDKAVNGYGGTLPKGSSVEGTLKWVVDSEIKAGTVVVFQAPDKATHGTLSSSSTITKRWAENFDLTSAQDDDDDDSIVAFQGTDIQFTNIIAAITWNLDELGEIPDNLCLAGSCKVVTTSNNKKRWAPQGPPSGQYIGPRSGLQEFSDYVPVISNFATNWTPNQDLTFKFMEKFSRRKRQVPIIITPFTSIASVSGDPHVKGAHGIKFDFNGVGGANYTLVSAPGFEITMQLATTGPDVRYMTRMALLFRGTSVVLRPMSLKFRVAELKQHFDALGVKTTFSDWRMSVELCPGHTITFTAMHAIDGSQVNFLDVGLDVPGCHNAYGGILGQTYQCKYATEKFVWLEGDVATEEKFRIPELTTTTGAYAPDGKCADEQEYR